MTALALDAVWFRYAGAAERRLAGVSLSADAGCVTSLYGAPGSGCSTLLLVAAGLAPRHTGGMLAGKVTLLGVDPHQPAERAALVGRVAYVTASPVVQLSGVAATVLEEVAFAPANLGWPAPRIRAESMAALERLGAAHLAARDPATLSGGELQRVVLAAMLVLAPEVWLLDEPAAPLDAAGRATLTALLRDEAARGAAVVVASEDADLLADTADRLVLLERGRVVADGPTAALLASETVWDSGPGSTSAASLARAAGELTGDAAFAAPYPLTVDEAVARWTR